MTPGRDPLNCQSLQSMFQKQPSDTVEDLVLILLSECKQMGYNVQMDMLTLRIVLGRATMTMVLPCIHS